MPVVLTDYTNRTWAVEQPNDGLLHVGYTGQSGPRLLDVLDFIESRKAQFEKFIVKRRQQELADGKKRRSVRRDLSNTALLPESGGVVGVRTL